MYQLTHNDLDGYGCRLVLEHYYQPEEVIHTDYNKISYYLKSLNNRIRDKKLLFITDLNFKTKEDFQSLLSLLQNNWIVLYFDHHEYSENNLKFFEYLKSNYKFFYFIDTSTCATKLLYDYITKKKEHNENLKQLVEIICTYDTWKTNNKLWEVAFMLNEIFYELTPNEFCKQIKENDYKIKKEWIELYKNKLKEKEKYYKALNEENLILNPNKDIKIFILPDYTYSTHINIDFNEKHKIFVYPTFGKISVRHEWNLDTEKEKADQFLREVEKLSKIDYITSAGGHLQAQGITFNSPKSLDEYELIINKLINLVSSEGK